MAREYLRVETLVRCDLSCWNNPNQVLRVIKRKGKLYPRYFVGAPDAAYGHGIWAFRRDLTPLTPLELLAMAAE